ncbi:MAG: diphthine--ammonia ligase [Methanotrichaceae archaeon]|nr:diphthine--ammonia ligase [Methanotrichaceae archaeon]
MGEKGFSLIGDSGSMMIESSTSNEGCKGKVVVSWTGGKDGCLAACMAIDEGYEVTHLLNFSDVRRYRSHDIDSDLLNAQSAAAGIPLIRKGFTSYEVEFKNAVRDLMADGSPIDGAVFGHIETHRDLVERICRDLGIDLILPIWKQSSEGIIEEMVDSGFDIMLASVKADLLGKEWLGRRIDATFVDDLRRCDPSIDLCGENGEFHTIVADCPIFSHPVKIATGKATLREGYWQLEMRVA